MHIFIQIGRKFVHMIHDLVQLFCNMQTWYWSYLYFFQVRSTPLYFYKILILMGMEPFVSQVVFLLSMDMNLENYAIFRICAILGQ